MNAWWQLFNRALTEEECNKIISLGLSRPAIQGTIGHGGTSAVNTQLRRSTVHWLDRSDVETNWLYEKINKLVLQANANAFGFDISGFHEVQFTEYNADNQGTYGWHEDLNWKKATPFDRKISMVIQLSKPEQYEGGRLELANDPLPADKFVNQGDIIFFPAFNRHRVLPVTRGIRYSLVTWFVGPKFK